MKILWGISGIGTGHSNRQLPIIRYFLSKGHTLAIFCYDESYRIYYQLFKDNKSITLIKVDIPFIAGNKNGLDWERTAIINQGKDFNTINSKAIAKAIETIGKPDLVISDYEPLSAQFAYAYDIPFVTFDQQSKYLCGEYPELNEQTVTEEIMRLRMFFPKANARIACSFFKVDTSKNKFDVIVLPSTLKEEILNLRKQEEERIIVYITSQREFVQEIKEVIDVLTTQKEQKFDIFIKEIPNLELPSNISIYKHGDNNRFYESLSKSKAIISTAGHTLLSEAMYLGIPVYAVPLSIYEQQMNANIIDENEFGISRSKIDVENLKYFLENLATFKKKIKEDKTILFKRSGEKEIIEILEKIGEKQ